MKRRDFLLGSVALPVALSLPAPAMSSALELSIPSGVRAITVGGTGADVVKTVYHCFMIRSGCRKPTMMFSTKEKPDLPKYYTKYRRIGSVGSTT